MSRQLGWFLGANAVLIVAIALAPFHPGPGASAFGEIAKSLVTRWLPFALTIATLLAAALARGSSEPRRILARHFWLYLAVPATTALLFFGDALDSRIIGVPYTAVVVAIAIGGVLAVWRDRAGRSDRAIGLLLGAVTLASAVALLPYDRTIQLTRSDEPHYLLIMESLVRDHDLDLGNNYDAADYADYYPDRLPDRHVIISGPRQLPIRDLGLPLLGALPFAIARRTGLLLVMCLVGGAFAWRGYAFLRLLSFSRHAAILAAAAAALLHPVFTYTTQIYPDLPAALAVLVVAELLARPPTIARLAVASAILGALPWLTVRAWFIVVGMGLVVAVVALRPLLDGFTRKRLALVAAGGAPFFALLGTLIVVDLVMFGIPVPNAGYYLIQGQQTVLAFTPQIGFPGLFLDRTFGLLSHVPLYALAFLGAVPLFRRARTLRSAGIVALFLGWLGYLIYIGDIAYWWADGSPSSRYQLATIAFPMLALAAGLERLRGELPGLVVKGALVWSVLVTVIFAWRPNLRYDLAVEIEPSAGPGQIWDFVTASLHADPGLIFPSLVHNAPLDVAITAAWLVLLGGLVVVGARAPRGTAAQRAPTMTG
ncbi:MAG: hypothetical protein NVS9B6_18990 [Candidatus Limnocylindrales bacterium]